MRGFDIPREQREAGEEAMEDRLMRQERDSQNDLICAELMGWKQIAPHSPPSAALPNGAHAVWSNGRASFETPGFSAWSTAGWILEAFARMGLDITLTHYGESPTATVAAGWWVDIPELSVSVGPFDQGFEAIRTAAVAVCNYVRERNDKSNVPNQMHNVPEDAGRDSGTAEGG